MIVNFTLPLFAHGVRLRESPKVYYFVHEKKCCWYRVTWMRETNVDYGVSCQASHCTLHYCLIV